jgi:hypothetical protein
MSLQKKVLDIITKKYKILEIIDLVFYDYQITKLHELLSKYENYTFAPDERILILHHDIDYYVSSNVCGFTMYNLVSILHQLNIPNEFLIMLTNHYGIKKEIQNQFNTFSNSQAFKVIYTSQWYDFPENIIIEEPKPSRFQKLYCCLNGIQRQHRMAMLCNLNEKSLLDQGIISYHFGEKSV